MIDDLRSFSFAAYVDSAQDKDIAMAVSGGPDSMALCRALSCWAADQARPPLIHALIVNHNIRPQAQEEATATFSVLEGWQYIRPKVLTVDQARLNAEDSALMEEARKARYEMMAAYCYALGIEKLFLAHHGDDQAETVLFRLAKGSGLDGLGGMRPVYQYDEKLQLIRPFLNVTKAALVAFCEAEKIPYVKDPTNMDKGYARPRLREAQEVLEREGLTTKRLGVTAGRLQRAADALDVYAGRAYKEALRRDEPQTLAFDFERLAAEPEDIRIRVVQKAMTVLRQRQGIEAGYGPGLVRIEALTQGLFASAPFRKQTLGGLMIARDDKEHRIVFEIEPVALLSEDKG